MRDTPEARRRADLCGGFALDHRAALDMLAALPGGAYAAAVGRVLIVFDVGAGWFAGRIAS